MPNGYKSVMTSGGGGTSDYSDLTNKPQINGVELSGNKTASNLGLASSTDMEKAYKSDDTSFTALDDGDYVPVYDISTSKAKKSTWSNIKSVLKTYFDTIYSTVTAGTGLQKTNNEMSIKPFVSGDMDEVIDTLPSVQARYPKYSTEEQVVGEWIDGKPIYQKTIQGVMPTVSASATASTNYAIGANVDTVVDANVVFKSTSEHWTQILTSFNDAFSNGAKLSVYDNSADSTHKNKVYISSNVTGWSGFTCYITIQYTKTT